MKIKINVVLLLSLLMLLFVACSDKETKEPPFLKIDSKTIGIKANAGEQTVPIKTNIENWTFAVASDASSWLSGSRQGNNLILTVTENTQADSRKGNITLSGSGISETIKVEQLGVEPAILVNSEIFTVESDGGEIELSVTSNIEYEIIIPEDITWIKKNPSTRVSTSMVTEDFVYKVTWNSEEEQREAAIIIKQTDGTLEKKVHVYQKGKEGYSGVSDGDIKDDVKVKIVRGEASSFQGESNIEKSFDDDMSTLYHSSWNNSASDYFPITLEYFFEEKEESIDYIIYYPRTDGNSNGRFKEVEIWTATKENPTYVKALDYDFKGSGSATKISFEKPLVNPTSVKFVVKSGAGDGQGFASCAEMEFYRVNPDNFDPLTIFSDLTCSELKPEITLTDIEKISNNLYRNIAFYIYKDSYPKEFRIEEFRAWPHPDDWAHKNKTSQLSLLDNPTGISVSADEDLIVFVGNTGGENLSIKVQNLDKPGGDGYGNASYYPLSEGVNKLTMRNKGLIYVMYHTPYYKSAPKVKIHFATGKVNGYFDSQKHQPSDWSKYLSAAVDDFFDVVGKHAHLTFPTQMFVSYTGSKGAELIAAFDDLVYLEKDFMGLIKYDRDPVNRAYFHAMYSSYMYSTSYRTAYNISGEDVRNAILNVDQLRKSPWGPAHEVGHTFQTRPGFRWLGMTEVSNNVHSLYVQTEWANPSRIETEPMGRYNNRYEKAYHNSFVKNTAHAEEDDVFCKLVPLWQLQLYFANARGNEDFYKDYYETVRTKQNQPNAGLQQLEFVKATCEVSNTDLTDFFRKWGFLTPVDKEIDDYGKARFKLEQNQIDNAVAEIKSKGYAASTEKIEYISDSNWEIFKKKQPVQKGTATKDGSKITMYNWNNVVAYEVYNGDKLIFVSNKNSFSIDVPVTDSTVIYAIAHDRAKIEVSF